MLLEMAPLCGWGWNLDGECDPDDCVNVIRGNRRLIKENRRLI